MSIKTLRIVAGAGAAVRKEIEGEPALAFAKWKTQGMYGVYLVRDEDLAALRESGEQFVDRKAKNEHKELSRVMLGHAKIPLVSGGYGRTGRLLQGVEALLRKAAQAGERNLYVIGADEKIFEELWEKAAPRDVRGQDRRGQDRRSAGREAAAHSQGSGGQARTTSSSRRLFDLLPEGEVPAELVRVYVGESDRVQEVRKLILLAAKADAPVLIMGETGTGKEVVARSVHMYSARSQHPFVAVNCGAIPRDLLESELFGSVGGVATGVTTRAGLWEMTGKGTLFLDEIGDLSPEHQVKILRALQESKVRRVGEAREREVGARIIAATNRNLFAMVQEGRFREDLYYRLRTLTIQTPSLREHPEDIPRMAQAFWKSITGDKTSVLGSDVLSRLRESPWPGNVRELKSVLLNAYTLFGTGVGVEHLDVVRQHPAPLDDAGHTQPTRASVHRRATRGRRAADVEKDELLIGSWTGTGEDLVVPGRVEVERKHTYKLRLELERKGGVVCGTMTAYVKERRRTDTAFIELIGVSGDYYSFQYSLMTPNASHYGIMLLHLLPIGDRMRGLFLTKKVFEGNIGIGALQFKKQKAESRSQLKRP